MIGGWFRDWATTCVKHQKRDRDEFWWSPGPPGRQYNIHYFNPKVPLKTFQGPNGRLQVLLSQQPSYIRFQYFEACCGACPADSSGQHGAPPLSTGENERTHNGLQHVATGKVLKIKSQVWNTYSLYHIFFSDRPCNVLLLWRGLDPKKHSTMTSCVPGPTLEWA